MSTTAMMEKPQSAKLIAPRADAIRHLRTVLEKGSEIKLLRIRNGDELSAARANKLEWVRNASDLLNGMFDNSSVADYINDFVGKVFPEYAEFGNFVEQFYEEIDYRLNKLRIVLKRIEQAGEPLAAATPSVVATTSPVIAEPVVAPSVAAITAPPVEVKPEVSHVVQPIAPVSSNLPPVTESTRESVMSSSHKVLFVSHGPKDSTSDAVLQFMQQLSVAVIEADHTNGLIDTLEGRNDTGFVVVVHSADPADAGKTSFSDSSMFKLGYCAGKLGIKRMVMMLGPGHAASAESHGIAHLPIDVNGGWQLHLARQMKRAGCDIDLNRLA